MDERDQADDEFAALPEPPRRRSPLVAVVVIALAGAIGWHLRAEVGYAFAGRTPEALGDARSLFARGVPLADNRYVVLSGQPDRRNALFIEPRGEKSRQTFFRLLGTGSRLLVRAADTSNRSDLQDRWSGRLRRFDQVAYAPQMRDYYQNEVKAARYLSPAALKDAITTHATQVSDRAGEPVKLEPGTTLNLEVGFADELAALASKEKYASLADAKHEVERLGLTITGGADTGEEYRVFVRAPAAERNQVIAKLESGDFGFALHDERIPVDFGKLALDGDQLKAGARVVPFAALQAASVDAPITIGNDAWVLTEGEAPADFWWAPALLLLLVVFAGFNVWYLLRSRDSRPRHAATKEG
jgi:hypothetical protein